MCKGAAAILNKNPIKINNKPKVKPCKKYSVFKSFIEFKIYIDSKFVVPVYE